LVEPFRPGVMERLGIGPEELLKHNPRLIYARLTGFGQQGPYAKMAGHDINYLAISGVLGHLGRHNNPPTPPANLLADYGGGLTCALGIVTCLFEREKSGKGQVIDCAMQDSTLYMASQMYKLRSTPMWNQSRGKNLIDTGAPFYDTYECKDGRFMSVGALEPQFFTVLLEKLELQDQIEASEQMNKKKWEKIRELIAKKFLTKTRDEWQKIFDGSDACVVPVLELEEISHHPHNAIRNVLIKSDGSENEKNVMLSHDPAPSPRLSRTPAVAHTGPAPKNGEHTIIVLKQCGLSPNEIQYLINKNIVSPSPSSL